MDSRNYYNPWNNQGKPVKRLVSMRNYVNTAFLVEFMRQLLPNLAHHCDMLKQCRNFKAIFLDNLQCTYMAIDYSNNLTIGIKKEPQLLHWSKKQVRVYSRIVKSNGIKPFLCMLCAPPLFLLEG